MLEENKTVVFDIETAGLVEGMHYWQGLYHESYREITAFLEKEVEKDKYKLLLII